jgi:putative acetyltransferase
MLIRDERPGDEDAIDVLTTRAFEPMPFSDGSEAPIIRALRQSGTLAVSLVAERDGKIVGHVAFSPLTIDGEHRGWFGLGPISVEPDMQRGGIGKALIAQGLAILKQRGAAGCALIGNPKIYGRCGFVSEGGLTYQDLESRLVQSIAFDGVSPQGELRFAAAFEMEGPK